MGSQTVIRAAAAEWAPPDADNADMQGLIASAYPHLPASALLLLAFPEDPAVQLDAAGWLTALAGRLTDATGKQVPSINVAFSATGLRALAFDGAGFESAMQMFSRPFVQGMGAPERARFLGDMDGDKPIALQWSDREVHALLLLYAADDAALQHLLWSERAQLWRTGVREVGAIYPRVHADDNGTRREHFGFADGFSQPSLIDGDAVVAAKRGWHDIPAGEIVLGHVNTYGEAAGGPVVPASDAAKACLQPAATAKGAFDFARNGSYLVCRQMRQDVAAFWNAMDENAARVFAATGKPATGEWLAERVIGRTLDGDMLVPGGTLPAVPRPTVAGGDPAGSDPQNDFGYLFGDGSGFGCPVGSHVRRMNPRDGLSPFPDGAGEALLAVNRHRILRRGRPYGPPAADKRVDDGIERGLVFLCLNSDIERQFEFIQHTWLMNPVFGGLAQEADAMLGPPGPFTIPGLPVRQKPALKQYVTTSGGGYFFLPSLSAVRYLAAMTAPE